MDPIRVRDVQRQLEQRNGGYEIVHESPGLETGGSEVLAASAGGST